MVQNTTYRCYLNPFRVCQGRVGHCSFAWRWVTLICDPGWEVVDIAGVDGRQHVTIEYGNILGRKTVVGALVNIVVQFLMVILGTFAAGVGRMGRRVSRVSTAVLTTVVLGVCSAGLSVLLVVGIIRVDVLLVLDGV